MEYVDLGESEPIKGIFINGIKYQYSLTKSEKEEEDSLMIKLYDPTNKSQFYFSYISSYEKIIKDIKFLQCMKI